MNLQQAQALDRTDPVAEKRSEFMLPDQVIYLDGNSLGAMPVAANERALKLMRQQWSQDLDRSWNDHNWIDLPVATG